MTLNREPTIRRAPVGLLAPALLLLWGGLLLGPAPARAADFTVNPIQIFLTGQTQSAILTVQNTSGEPLRFQLNAFAWAQDAAGQMLLTPTSEIIFFPRLLTLAPGEQRIVRVGTSVPGGPIERTYRIFVEELPPPSQQAAPARPGPGAGPHGDPDLRRGARRPLRAPDDPAHPAARAARVRAPQCGDQARDPPGDPRAGAGAGGETVWEGEQEGWYILAGEQRVYEMPFPREECVKTKAVAVEVKAGEQTLTERLDIAVAACGP